MLVGVKLHRRVKAALLALSSGAKAASPFWCISKQGRGDRGTLRLGLRALLLLIFVSILTIPFTLTPLPSNAAVGINQQINFQGKLVNSNGTNIPDGTYNIEFKIYQDGTGCVSSGTSPCGGTL